MFDGGLPRRWLVRSAVALAVVVLVVAATASVVGYERTTLGNGTIREAPRNDTVISVQGFHFRGIGNGKKPARLVSAGPNGSLEWVYGGSRRGAVWFYDVDLLPDGNLLVTSTVPGKTLVYELDPETGERAWQQVIDAEDTHDVDLINGDQLLVAHMRNYDEAAGVNRDRVFVYDMGDDEVVWEWQFRDHFPRSAGGDYTHDWTHVNDVDKVADGKYLVSPRNLDQVFVVDRETDEITYRLGEDGNDSRMKAQHNPDWLTSADGNPTVLVADSEQDRVVEYEHENGEWNRTWELTGRFSWPRDADRLPNGNTLVTDSLHHRVVEVTPRGEVVWEYYAAWAPYDAERVGTGDGSRGPTIADMNATGSYVVHGGTEDGPKTRDSVGKWLASAGFRKLGEQYAHVMPFFRPVWIPSWAWAQYVVAAVLLVGWSGGELVAHRRRVRRALGGLRERLLATGRDGA